MEHTLEESLKGSLEALEEALEESPENLPEGSPAEPFDDSLEDSLEVLDEPLSLDEPAGASPDKPKAAASAPGKHAKPAKQRTGKGLKITLGVLVGLVLVIVGLGYGYYHGKISLLQFDDGSATLDGTIDETDAVVIEQAAEMDQAVADLPLAEPIIDFDTQWEYTNAFDENVINILLLGTDERSKVFTDAARSDTIILMSINLDTGAIKLISIERGMGAPVLEGRYKGEWDWITHIFRYGGADLMMKTVSTCFDLDVHYYIRVNFNTFIQLVDSMGGIDITLTQREADGLNTNIVAYNRDLCDWVHAGENHMNGFLALQYARMRKIDSDWVRVTRQRATIGAIMAKAKSLSVSELDAVLEAVLPLIKTKFTEEESQLAAHESAAVPGKDGHRGADRSRIGDVRIHDRHGRQVAVRRRLHQERGNPPRDD
ncbi:MAG: LCP family protein, partial [Eggerthellaceae bacterium]|nr:LCP family protein [Eggerthellaceae bacterium]